MADQMLDTATPHGAATRQHHHAAVPLHKRHDHKDSPLKKSLAEFLESRAAEFTILFLVLCDVVLVAMEAGIDFKVLCIAGQVMAQSALNPASPHVKAAQPPEFILGKAQHFLQPVRLIERPEQVLVCETPEGYHAEHITHTCHLLSIAILCIFMVELLLKIWVHGKEFFYSAFEVLDLVIVSLSLICDVWIARLVENGSEEGGSGNLAAAETASALLIILRFWRIVRIVHGFYEIQHMDSERVTKQLEEKDAEIERLHMLLSK